MSVGVGLRVGTTVSSVAVTSAVPGQPGPEPIERRSAVHLHQDGTATLGEIDPILDQGASSFTNFLDGVGSPAGIRAADGSLSRAEDLVATAMECLLADAAPLIGDRQYTVVAAHPTEWAPATVSVLRNALDYVGLRHVSLVSDAEAAAAWFESQVSRQTGRLVAVYHIDDHGSSVTLVRAGVAAGKPVRFGLADAPPVTKQLAAALAGFGWQVSNLDAVVVTTDENVDSAAAQLVAQSVKAGLGTRCALAPDPHQTMVRGAALAAAAGSVEYLGSTQIIPMTRANLPRKQTPQSNTAPRLVDPDATTTIPKVAPPDPRRATPSAAQPPKASVGPAPASTTRTGDTAAVVPSEDENKRRTSPILLALSAAAVVLLAVMGVLVLTQRGSAAETSSSVADLSVTATAPEMRAPTSGSTTATPTTTRAATTTTSAEETTSAAAESSAVTPIDDAVEPTQSPVTSQQSPGPATFNNTAPQSTTTRQTPSWQSPEEKPTRDRDRDNGSTSPTQTPTETPTETEPSESEPGSTTGTTGETP